MRVYDSTATTPSRDDRNGNRSSVVYDGGTTEEYTYDKDNLLTLLNNKRGDGTSISSYSYTYDLAGRIHTKTDSFGTTTYSYDADGRITQVETPGKTSIFAYDQAGNRLSLNETYTSQQFSGYVDETANPQTNLNYLVKGSEYIYSDANRLLKLVEKMYDGSNNEVIRKCTDYFYDANGNQIASSSAHMRVFNAGLGETFQITSSDETPKVAAEVPAESKPLDTGNGASFSISSDIGTAVDPLTKEVQAYKDTNLATAFSISGGNGTGANNNYETVEETVSNQYDGFNRLKKSQTVKNGCNVTVEYGYNGDDLRVKKVVSRSDNANKPEISLFVYDGQNVILETDGGEAVKARYVLGMNYIGRVDADSHVSYFMYNGHNDVVQTVAAGSGAVECNYEYDVFGTPTLTVEGYNCPIRYAGEYYDSETGEYYLHARYYDSFSGRFTTEDTFEDPNNNNQYVYCANDPIQYVDPTGHILMYNTNSRKVEFVPNEVVSSALASGYQSLASRTNVVGVAPSPAPKPPVPQPAQNGGSSGGGGGSNGNSGGGNSGGSGTGETPKPKEDPTPKPPDPKPNPTPQKTEVQPVSVAASNPRTEEQMHAPLMAGNSANVQDFSFPYELNYNDPEYARKYHDLTVVLQKYLIDRGNLYGFEGSPYSSLLKWNIDISYAAYIEDGVDSRDQLGYYGLRTRNAVKWFQKEVMHMQNPDGIVGNQTWHAMGLPEPGSDFYNWMLSANGRGWDATKTAWNDYYKAPESSAQLKWASIYFNTPQVNDTAGTPTPVKNQPMQGDIPGVYSDQIMALMKQHPNWKFEFVNTGINWNDFISKEVGTNSLTQRPSWIEDYKFNQDGWYIAKQSVVEYFADPRNFLNERNIFQFEKLSYDPNIHTKEGVAAILKGTFMDSDTYVQYFMEAAQQVNVSPYFLASKARLEMGSSGNPLSEGTVEGYNKFYNYYNIGAYPHGGLSTLTNGAIYAKKHGWNSRESAITGGANVIASSYISVGQDTMYTQKFDLTNFSNQFVQNIEAGCEEGSGYYNGYKRANALESSFVFKIPYFNGMPSSPTQLP